ncbi:MAG: polymerase [Chthoniobacter sp.]|jgi:hypothetical protein|nr:polymerase [Chthoniobacter sp.]
MDWVDHFDEVWVEDFEFTQPPGWRPTPLCYVARELRTSRLVRKWLVCPPNQRAGGPPYSLGDNSLVVTYFGAAEVMCRLALGWQLPPNHIDLYAEFRLLTCGHPRPTGFGLVDALRWFGLDAMAAAEKEEMRALAMRDGPYTGQEQEALLAYCEEDVDATAKLALVMIERIYLGH